MEVTGQHDLDCCTSVERQLGGLSGKDRNHALPVAQKPIVNYVVSHFPVSQPTQYFIFHLYMFDAHCYEYF
jgi:hypothetical protein